MRFALVTVYPFPVSREGVIPQGPVAEVRVGLLAELQLEGELALPVVGRRLVEVAGGQRRLGVVGPPPAR